MINIGGLDKARVLKALYDNSHQNGFSYLQNQTGGIVTVDDCRERLAQDSYVDYFNGRVIKVDFSGDTINERLYDRDCGQGAAARAIDSIR